MIRRIGVLAAVAVGLATPSVANATFSPQADITLRCRDGRAVAVFTYTGFNPANQHLVATQRLEGRTKQYPLVLNAVGSDTDVMSAPLIGQVATASTVVTSASGRVKAQASAQVRCSSPPPPDRVATSARLIGPCGDPMYAAVFNNRRSTVPVVFRWRYHSFDLGGYVTLVQRVAAGHSFRTRYKHVTGSTMTSIRAHGETLLRRRTAPGGNYAPCR